MYLQRVVADTVCTIDALPKLEEWRVDNCRYRFDMDASSGLHYSLYSTWSSSSRLALIEVRTHRR